MAERILEFFAYEEVGMAVTSVAAIPCLNYGDFRIMFPSEEERTKFLELSPSSREEYLLNALRNQ